MNHKAFVSSTFQDLKDHRAHVIMALRRAGFVVDPMEDWTADSDEPRQFSQDRLKGCELCVVLVAFRRGYVPDGEIRSITQLEYDKAVEQGLDILAFMLKDDSLWWREFDERDRDPDLIKWREKLMKSHGVEFFTHDSRSIDMSCLPRWLQKKKAGQPEHRDSARIAWPDGKSPYPGLLWFDEEYAPLFFGRDREVDAVLAKMNEPEGRVLIISGTSGSGKSSLVAAGVWRALLKEERLPGSAKWVWLRIQLGDGKSPWDSLAWGLKQALGKVSTRPDELANELAGHKTAMGKLLALQLAQGQELVLFIDQLEELFTQGFKDEDIKSFLDQLLATACEKAHRLRVVATVRSEFMARLEESESVLQIFNAGYNYHLGPVSPRILQEMIEKPAQATGYDFEPGLVEDMLHEAAQEPGSLPLVAYALKELFERRRARTFTHHAYQTIGGVAGAIGAHAKSVQDKIREETGSKTDEVLPSIFQTLANIQKEEGVPTRNHQLVSGFPPNLRKVVDLLVKERLLRTAGEGEAATVSISHEKLFEAWPALQEYVRTHHKMLMDRTLLESRARKWMEMGKPWFSGLASGREYKDFRGAGMTDTALTKEYLRASRRATWIQTGVIGVLILLVGGIGAWLWREGQQGLTVEQAVLRAASKLTSIHVMPAMETVAGGTFRQGDTHGKGNQAEQPVHTVAIKGFAIGKFEVTFEEYERFALATDRLPLPNDQSWGRGRRPVINVSWENARAYAAWLSQQTGKRYRLPTEAEWEYAARSGGKEEVWVGTSKEEELDQYAVFRAERTAVVGGKKPNSLGLYDLSGNVYEWVEDCWHNNYTGAPTDGSAWLEADGGDCKVRVFRGGSWLTGPGNLRASGRTGYGPGNRYDLLGFRLVQDMDK